ncbi:MAG: restriction endonuclease subunit S [Christensenellales bacterium]
MSKVKLGDVAIEHKETCKGSKDGYPIVGLEHLIPEEVTLTAWDEGSDNTFTKMFRKGNVLFGRRRAYLKKAAVAPFDGICSGDITVIEAIPDRILPELLPFIIQNDELFDFAVGKSAGSLSPRVKWEHLKNYEFELPDMDKQRELAELLWAMDATKKSYQKLIAATDELVKSQFIEMFGNPMTNDKHWPTKKMKDVAPSSPYTGEIIQNTNGYWLLNLDMVESNSGRIIEKVYVAEDEIGQSTTTFSSKYVLYSKLRPYLNKVVVPDDDGYATTELIPLLPNQQLLTQLYLAQLLRGDEFLAYISSQVSGTKMPRVTMNVFWDFDVMLPPLYLQERYAAFVRQSDKSKFELEQALSELTATYKRIIAKNLG